MNFPQVKELRPALGSMSPFYLATCSWSSLPVFLGLKMTLKCQGQPQFFILHKIHHIFVKKTPK